MLTPLTIALPQLSQLAVAISAICEVQEYTAYTIWSTCKMHDMHVIWIYSLDLTNVHCENSEVGNCFFKF